MSKKNKNIRWWISFAFLWIFIGISGSGIVGAIAFGISYFIIGYIFHYREFYSSMDKDIPWEAQAELKVLKAKQRAKQSFNNAKVKFSGVDLNSSVDNQYYVQAQKEIAEKSYDEAIMIKCKVAANGDESKANAIYVKHRVNELKEEKK